jgi:D-3-phosphoglycerate dehydrogenase / 2-oxoglutarate reductase
VVKEHSSIKKILVVQAIRLEALRLFQERPDIHFEVLTDFSHDNLLRHIADADALTVRDAPVLVDILEAAPRLQVISRHGVGFDNIPVDYCTARGLPVTVVGDVNSSSVAEQTMFLALAAARGGILLDAAVREGDFAARTRITGVELRGRRLLLIGFGRIGREVAVRAAAFGMRISVYDPFVDPTLFPNIIFVATLEEGLVSADVVSLHVPLNLQTKNMISHRELALLPVGAIVINTARGGILDESAMLTALKNNHLLGVGLDTFEIEPVPLGHPLLKEKKAILSPHSGALTEESLIAMGVATARNALAGLDGTLDPAFVVNPAVLKRGSNAL